MLIHFPVETESVQYDLVPRLIAELSLLKICCQVFSFDKTAILFVTTTLPFPSFPSLSPIFWSSYSLIALPREVVYFRSPFVSRVKTEGTKTPEEVEFFLCPKDMQLGKEFLRSSRDFHRL